MGETANVHGVLSQRWDLNGLPYADIWVRECAPLKIEYIESENFLTFERDNGQITIRSSVGMKKISVYDMSGRVVFQNKYSSTVNNATFGLATKQSVVISVETEDRRHFSRIVLI